jgi:hypothetical protein
MAIANHFYNGSTRKYVAIFGSIFNKISITREDNEGNEIQRLVVPISYGPYQKFLARITQDPNFEQKSAITLPRMSFEILSMNYDSMRKVGSTRRMTSTTGAPPQSKNFLYAPAPYNIEFNLYIMTKYTEDGAKIMEQIIPFFKPEYTVSANLMDGLDPFDIPIVLNGVSSEDLYEADFESRRTLMWTLSFSMKAYFFGPIRNRKVIKFVESNIYSDMDQNKNPASIVTIQPGLTANGVATNSLSETIPYEEINMDDDWGIIKIVKGYEDEEGSD